MAGNTQFIYERPVDIDRLLREYTPLLRKNINPTDIYSELLDLRQSDKEQIMCRTTQEGNMRGMDTLLECIARCPRSCFFDFLVLLEKNGYTEKSERIINCEGLINSTELADARERYRIRNEEHLYMYVVQRKNEHDRPDHQLPNFEQPFNTYNNSSLNNPVPNQMMYPVTNQDQPNFPHHQSNVPLPQPNFPHHQSNVPLPQPNFPHHQRNFPHHQPKVPHHQSNFPHHQSNVPLPQPKVPHHQPNFPHPQPNFPHPQPNFPHHQSNVPLPQPNFPHHQPKVPHHQPNFPHPQPTLPHADDSDQGIIQQSNPLQRMKSAPCDMSRLDSSLGGNGQHSNIPGRPGQNVNTFYQNLDQCDQRGGIIPQDPPVKSKDDFEIDLTQIRQTGDQMNSENDGSLKPSGQFGSRQIVVHGGAAISSIAESPISSSPPQRVQTDQNNGQQRFRKDEMNTSQTKESPNKDQSPLHNTSVMHTAQLPSSPRQQGPPDEAQDDRDIGDLTDEVFSKLVEALGRGGESPLWKKVGRKAGITRKDMRVIDHETLYQSTNAAQVMLDKLYDSYGMSVKKLRDILQLTGCLEALQILEGPVELQQNIEVSDDENWKLNDLDHVEDRQDEMSSDLNTMSSENTGSFDKKSSEVIENVSTALCREAQEHEHLKCEASQEMSEDCSKDMKSVEISEVSSSGSENQNQRETTVNPVEAETDQDNKNSGMDLAGLSGDISANLREGDAVEEAPVSTVSVISNKMLDVRLNSAQGNEGEEFPADFSGVQAQADANYSHSEKPLCLDTALLRREIQTQPNISSFRDLQHSIPALQGEGVSTLSVSEPDHSVVGTTSTLSVSEPDHSVVGTTSSDHQSFQNDLKKDEKHAELSLGCGAGDRVTLSKTRISGDVSTQEEQLTVQSSPGLSSQETAVSEVSDQFFNNKAVFDNHTASLSNRDVHAFKAEGDQHLKQSALPPDIDRENFQREIQIQQPTAGECSEQHSSLTSADLQAPGGETEASLHTGSFRDVQNSVPEYRSEDLDNPNSSLPRNVDSLVMDEDETFLKEKNRPL